MTRSSTLPPILRALASSLPPVEEPLPVDAPSGLPPGLRPAAVLIVFFPREGDTRFLLTARLDTLTHHPGQISLPGGKIEPADPSAWHAAVRETREELDMRTGRLLPLGRLSAVPTVVSNHVIVPFAAWNPVAPRVRPHAGEVAEVLEVPLAALLDPASVAEEVWELRGRPYIVTLYRFGGQQVWGATARILSDLAGHLAPESVRWEHPPGSVRPA